MTPSNCSENYLVLFARIFGFVGPFWPLIWCVIKCRFDVTSDAKLFGITDNYGCGCGGPCLNFRREELIEWKNTHVFGNDSSRQNSCFMGRSAESKKLNPSPLLDGSSLGGSLRARWRKLILQHPVLPFLVFLISLFFFPRKEFLVFCGFLPSFPGILGFGGDRKSLFFTRFSARKGRTEHVSINV